MKPTLIEIKSSSPDGRITTGRTTRVYLDGQEVRGATKVELVVEAGKPAQVKLTLHGEIEVAPMFTEYLTLNSLLARMSASEEADVARILKG